MTASGREGASEACCPGAVAGGEGWGGGGWHRSIDAIGEVGQREGCGGQVKQKISSGGKYISVNIGPVQVVSSEQADLKISPSQYQKVLEISQS
ncbi:hypothetical protein RJ639_029204 [Escallonia herrerae]|uniref:Uncharacterized protein n=1 Tax=Escallonia herrerae TaxID=1293975 RepID=A0AA89BFY1_9ASTE|nr:hypothetical protein RJ639_029204 [Escallonia herrerae]